MKLVAKTLYGLESVLATEVAALGGSDVKSVNRAVTFTGDKELLYKVNYCARTALSFLMPVGDFRIRSKDDLYKGGLRIDWSIYMDANDTFSIAPAMPDLFLRMLLLTISEKRQADVHQLIQKILIYL
jgi:putative N6-adenine-specific DNA methylase